MPTFNELISQGTANAWFFIPTAILLGALHGLEPGHSKTMMAAFIVAIRGSVTQAVLLGVSAAFSHSLIIWVIAALALKYGSHWNAETTEPYFQIASGFIIVSVAIWMFVRTRREQDAASAHSHTHHEEHDHPHGGEHHHHHEEHDHPHSDLNPADHEYQDAHEKAHAADIRKRFSNRSVTTGQIVLFGLTGGLLPCPAALTVLLICLQLKHFTLGFTLVLCFSFGLAVTMVLSGTIAALAVKHTTKRFKGFGAFARTAPYFSSALLICLGLYVGIQGWLHLK